MFEGLQNALSTIAVVLCLCLAGLGVVALFVIRFVGGTFFGLWDSSGNQKGTSKDADYLASASRSRESGRSRIGNVALGAGASFDEALQRQQAQSAPPTGNFGAQSAPVAGYPPQAGQFGYGVPPQTGGYPVQQPQQPQYPQTGGFGQPPQPPQYPPQGGFGQPPQPPQYPQTSGYPVQQPQPPQYPPQGGFGQPPQPPQYPPQGGFGQPPQPPQPPQYPPQGGFGQPPQQGNRPSLSPGKPYVPPLRGGGGALGGGFGDADTPPSTSLRGRSMLRPRNDRREILDDGEDDAGALSFLGF